ncbi:hypothetical protein EYF80_068229 [Liparis tanakae]|uniref:Uncharacterized protein n=1 Tax=Liparis tanakae TaxID=230148 RepID=A0A4Z2DYZ3_9TELE|nr:hypothetical protein EYF80_068229 [Liparis tanakae]
MMRSQRAATASSMTACVRSLVSRMLLTGRGSPGSTRRPTLSHDSARDRGASCSNTCRTSFSSIGPEWRAGRERRGDERGATGALWWL